MKMYKSILFVDIKASTAIIQKVENYEEMDGFIYFFYNTLYDCIELAGYERHQIYIKPLGDGALIALDEDLQPAESLKKIENLIQRFELRLEDNMDRLDWAFKTELYSQLRWGVSRGPVRRISMDDYAQWEHRRQYFMDNQEYGMKRVFDNGFVDFYGPCINLAARLCGLARPYGVIIDRSAFPVRPAIPIFEFIKKGISVRDFKVPFDAWVSSGVDIEAIWSEKADIQEKETE